MAANFNGSAYLSFPITTITAYPITMFSRVKSTDMANDQVVFAYIQVAGGYTAINTWVFGASGDAFSFFRWGATGATAGTYVNGQWHALGGRSRSSSDFDVVYDGTVAAGAGTTAWAGTSPSTLNMGGRLIPSLTNPLTGALGDVAMWDVGLTDLEMTSLSKGFPARRIRPQSLKFHAPLVREFIVTQGIVNGAITNSSATVTDHPRSYGL